ncbi:hypothetical protein GCK72_020174 [Caenorhabditis remanei]|uniref:Uncharacterized protein n=1 Tax=Caenorhabditis remanei TaxID=31234 RepID=A0A6A5GEE9_CAERE|nr:hypothetical protein GCK72_020174 [Caenorhabditis remanei]KAF1753617.1 hypothetical protein GCK72_020174 [Caenorhabditis remanei]
MSRFNLFVLICTLMSGFVMSQEMTKDEMATYNKFLADQKRLWKDLFTDYDSTLSAIYTLHKSQWIDQNTTTHPPITQLTLIMAMLKLVDVTEVEEKVTFIFDYSAEWTDHRLKWNPLEYGGISHIYVPQKQIWLPEITIADAHEVKFFESDDAPRTAWINFNGTVGFYTSTVVSVICQLDVFKFPMDEHECGVSVLFHTYFADEYGIKGEMEKIEKPLSQLGNGEWKVSHIGVAVQPAGNADYAATQRFIARFQRNPGFYVALVMVPAFFINFLSIIALFLNIENVGEKVRKDRCRGVFVRSDRGRGTSLKQYFIEQITVGLTNIMGMTFILVILAEDLPKTARIPLLAIYVIVGLVIVMSSIVVVLIIPVVRKYQKKKKNNSKQKFGESSKFERLCNWIRIEFVLMFIFQAANFINFIILFL